MKSPETERKRTENTHCYACGRRGVSWGHNERKIKEKRINRVHCPVSIQYAYIHRGIVAIQFLRRWRRIMALAPRPQVQPELSQASQFPESTAKVGGGSFPTASPSGREWVHHVVVYCQRKAVSTLADSWPASRGGGSRRAASRDTGSRRRCWRSIRHRRRRPTVSLAGRSTCRCHWRSTRRCHWST